MKFSVNEWKKRGAKFICILTVGFLLAGCGEMSKDPETAGPEDGTILLPGALTDHTGEELANEYTDLSILFRRLTEQNLPNGDFTLGAGNQSSWRKEVDASSPIFTLYVNPLATREVMEDYVTNALAMDQLLGEDAQYQQFMADNSPYFITFESRGETIYRMDLTGLHTREELLEELSRAARGVQEKTAQEFEVFQSYLEGVDFIEKDETGSYYYVLDSGHVTQSLKEIMSCARQIASHHPLESREAWLYTDSWKKMGYPEGSFRIYLDQYGGELITRSHVKDDTGEYPFSVNEIALYFQVYNHFVEEGNLSPDPSFHCLYFARIGKDGTTQADLSFEGNPAGATSFSREEIAEKTYEIYQYLASVHAAHGIEEFPVLGVNGHCALPKDQGGLWIQISAEVPLTAPISFEEYCSLLDEGSTIFDPKDYEEPDDCL